MTQPKMETAARYDNGEEVAERKQRLLIWDNLIIAFVRHSKSSFIDVSWMSSSWRMRRARVTRDWWQIIVYFSSNLFLYLRANTMCILTLNMIYKPRNCCEVNSWCWSVCKQFPGRLFLPSSSSYKIRFRPTTKFYVAKKINKSRSELLFHGVKWRHFSAISTLSSDALTSLTHNRPDNFQLLF